MSRIFLNPTYLNKKSELQVDSNVGFLNLGFVCPIHLASLPPMPSRRAMWTMNAAVGRTPPKEASPEPTTATKCLVTPSTKRQTNHHQKAYFADLGVEAEITLFRF